MTPAHPDFLLSTPLAADLFHQVAGRLPVIDYHCHLDPSALASDRAYPDLDALCIAHDPYKHRLMRIDGASEAGITGASADPRARFARWAATLPGAIGSRGRRRWSAGSTTSPPMPAGWPTMLSTAAISPRSTRRPSMPCCAAAWPARPWPATTSCACAPTCWRGRADPTRAADGCGCCTSAPTGRSEVDRQPLGEIDHPGLGQGVGGHAGQRAGAVHRGEVDDPPTSQRRHLAPEHLGGDEGAEGVGADHALQCGGIRVNGIAPGFFVNERSRKILTLPDGSLSARGLTVMQHTPLKRFGQPGELAGAVLWLLDDERAGFVTGQTIAVDGGFLAATGV